MSHNYEARIVYRDALGVQGVEYVWHDAQDAFYAMFTGAVLGLTQSRCVISKAEILRTPMTSIATNESGVL